MHVYDYYDDDAGQNIMSKLPGQIESNETFE